MIELLFDGCDYPNSIRSRTDFTPEVSRDANVTIKIYTLTGRPIKTIKAQATANFNAIQWDGLDEVGDRLAKGLFLYQVKVRAPWPEGHLEAESLRKLVIAEQGFSDRAFGGQKQRLSPTTANTTMKPPELPCSECQ